MDTLPHPGWCHCAVFFTYSKNCFSVPPTNLASQWSRQIKLWRWKRGPRSPLQESSRTHFPSWGEVTVCYVSFKTVLIRWHFSNLWNRCCPISILVGRVSSSEEAWLQSLLSMQGKECNTALATDRTSVLLFHYWKEIWYDLCFSHYKQFSNWCKRGCVRWGQPFFFCVSVCAHDCEISDFSKSSQA